MIRIDGNGLPEVFGGLIHFIFLEEKDAQPEVGQGIVGKVLDGKQEMLFGFFLLFAFDVYVGKQVVSLGVGSIYLQGVLKMLLGFLVIFFRREDIGQVVKGFRVPGIDLKDLKIVFLRLRKVGPVNQGSFLVGGDTAGK